MTKSDAKHEMKQITVSERVYLTMIERGVACADYVLNVLPNGDRVVRISADLWERIGQLKMLGESEQSFIERALTASKFLKPLN